MLPYLIEIIAPLKPVYRVLPEWARHSLDKELLEASMDPHCKTEVHPEMPTAYFVRFGDDRGLCMYEVQDDKERIEVRQIHWPY